MVGFESGWFFRDTWKLNLGGGINFTNSPGYTAVPGTIDEDSEIGDGSIPNYRAVADSYSFSYNVFTGIDKYYKIKRCSQLNDYGGIRIGFAYGLNEMKYDEPEINGQIRCRNMELARRAYIRFRLLSGQRDIRWLSGRSVLLHLQHDFCKAPRRAK
jgi:hypothetical protein